VEQIAEASDSVNYMGLQSLKNRAKAFLAASKDVTAPIEKLTRQMEELQAQNKVLAETIEAMSKKQKEKA
jgi:hypothetical protein